MQPRKSLLALFLIAFLHQSVFAQGTPGTAGQGPAFAATARKLAILIHAMSQRLLSRAPYDKMSAGARLQIVLATLKLSGLNFDPTKLGLDYDKLPVQFRAIDAATLVLQAALDGGQLLSDVDRAVNELLSKIDPALIQAATLAVDGGNRLPVGGAPVEGTTRADEGTVDIEEFPSFFFSVNPVSDATSFVEP